MSQQIATSEREQLLESAKMFEQVAESQPDDYQTLETLEETYVKLGLRAEALRTTRKLANAYARCGMVAKALAAYESVLAQDPKDEEAVAALRELKKGANKEPMQKAPPTATAPAKPRPDDHDLALGRLLVSHGMLTTRQMEALMQELQKKADATGAVPATCLADLVHEGGLATADAILELLCDKFKLPHLPLEFYDVNADIVKILPRDMCFKYLVAAFDRIGRTLMVTTVNPAVRPHVEAFAAKSGFTLQWYLNRSQEIKAVLQQVYRLGSSEGRED
jgi:tetratricopeptide (TPR) repeat protein